MLAPNAEVSLFPWKEPKERIPLAVARSGRSFGASAGSVGISTLATRWNCARLPRVAATRRGISLRAAEVVGSGAPGYLVPEH